MDVNATLLLSLKQDIKVLNELAENLLKKNNIKDLKTWIFSSNSAFKTVFGKDLKNVSYQNYLELTVDRVYVLVRLLLISLEKSCSSQNSRRNGWIVEPHRLSLGFSFELLGKSFSEIMENMNTLPKTALLQDHKNLRDKEVQTNIISISKCDSCASAVMCMKNLLNFFEEQRNSTERVKLQYKIYDITQFGCMLKATSTIEQSLSILYEQLCNTKKDNDHLKIENERLKTEMGKNDRKIAFLDAEVKLLKEKYENVKGEAANLKQRINELAQENNTKDKEINIQNAKVDNFRKCLKSLNAQNEHLKKKNINYEKYLEKSKNVLSMLRNQLHTNSNTIDSERSFFKCAIEEYEKSFTALNIKLIKIAKNVGKIDMKIKTFYEQFTEILQALVKYEEFSTKIKHTFKEKLATLKEDIQNPPENFKVKGNPIEDLTKQVEQNKNKIEDLENENIKLEKILYKFQNIKLSK